MAMLALAVAMTLAAQPADAARCSIDTPAGCANTNQLILLPRTRQAIRAFFGTRREPILDHRQLADVAITELHGPPADAVRVGDYWRFSACEAHACPTGGAMVLDARGGIVAIGLLDACVRPPKQAQCSAHWTLTAYTRGARPEVVADLRTWAIGQIAGPPVAGLPASRLDKVEVVRIRP